MINSAINIAIGMISFDKRYKTEATAIAAPPIKLGQRIKIITTNKKITIGIFSFLILS